MTSIERVQAAVNFEAPDRAPVIAQVFGHTAVIAGKTLGDYARSGKEVADCQLKALERYGYDAVFAIMDVNIETEALGSKLVYRRDNYPYVELPAFSKNTNLDSIPIPNPAKSARMPEILDALDIMRREVGNEVLIVGGILGPMTLATQLLGMETALYLAIDEPESFEKLLDYCVRVAVEFGVAQVRAGAHVPLVFDPSASQAVIPPQFFREFELPRLKQVFAALKSAGAAAGWLHVAGPISSIVPSCVESGADIFNFDYCVEPGLVIDQAPSICVNGNIKSLDFEEAPPEEVLAESLRLLELFARRGGYILSSGCEIPPGSRPENVHAMVSATRKRR
ncbi:MAG: uroporphyrinogen decarboxylase family protein [Syntrophobacteraceae bacterium]